VSTGIYAALLGLLLILLSVRTIQQRRRAQVAIGTAGDAALERAIRVHANFCEYVPIALILVYFVELQFSAIWITHALGGLLLLGRLLHAFGVSHEPENLRFRVSGMMLTFGVIATAAALNLAGPLLPA